MTTMQRISYEEVETTPVTTVKEAIFISEDLGNKTYEGIMEKYKEYRFEEHIQNLREEFGCQSNSTLSFRIVFEFDEEENSEFIMFCSDLQIPSRDEIEYTINNITEEMRVNNFFKEKVDKFFKENNYNKVYVEARMGTKFFIHRSLDIMNQYEEEADELLDEGYSDDEKPPVIVESPFISDNCSICLSNIPNILFFPCLHQSVCSQCEEVGKLLKCSVCRKKIERKIKI